MRVVVVLVVVVVTWGKQSQLLVRLTWTGMDLDWSLTTKNHKVEDELCTKIPCQKKFISNYHIVK